MFKNKNNFSYLFIFLSLFFLFYVIFKSEVYFLGAKRSQYQIYYYLSFIFIFISVFSLFFSNKFKIYFNIFTITFFLAIYFLEFSIQIYKTSSFNNLKKNITKEIDLRKINYKKETGKEFDDRSKREVYFQSKKQNPNTVVAIPPHYFAKYKELSIYDILPLSGISNSPTILCNENGYYSSYLSDRYGFNNPDEEWDSDYIEFLIVGGSYTNGSCVNRPNDMASVLRTLSGKKVLTIGMGGSSSLLQLASLKEYLNPSVKNVIWIYYDFNLLDLKDELQYPSQILKNYLIKDNYTQDIIKKQKLVDEMGIRAIEFGIKKDEEAQNQQIQIEKLNNIKNEKFSSKVLKILKLQNIREKLIYTHLNENSYPEEEFKKILEKAKNLAASNNANFYFVYLPTHQRYITNVASVVHDFKFGIYPKVKKISKDLDLNFIDLHKDFLEKQKNYHELLPLGIDGHFNENGYKKVTEFIYSSILKNN